ncbi:hypothetical protein K0M31_002230 [Melipona bicolor]|uniref:Histone-lysine N-methyltransferase SETMAR n=1 Tax=Melipona bicolor TaxID=60889 RepID=A0AA40KYN0_9HYME|nr:hypothetical protein K0M31_002230 [Melipona bicolor]
MSHTIVFRVLALILILGDLESVTVVNHHPDEEYFLEHEIPYEEAIMEAKKLQLYPGPIPGCKICTNTEMSYCKDGSVINDHCCCDGSSNVWWDYKGILYFELMPQNQTINSNVYVEQLDKLNDAIEEKRPVLSNRKGVVFHHDNARPHTSLVTRQKLLELGWDVLSHPPYSPDLAPSDYHLFRSMQNSLNGKIFNNADDVRSHLIQFFNSKDQTFYERGIFTLPERWKKVIDKNGQYLIE